MTSSHMSTLREGPGGCPSRFGLERWLAQELSPEMADVYARHTADCPHCLQVLESLKLEQAMFAQRFSSSALAQDVLERLERADRVALELEWQALRRATEARPADVSSGGPEGEADDSRELAVPTLSWWARVRSRMGGWNLLSARALIPAALVVALLVVGLPGRMPWPSDGEGRGSSYQGERAGTRPPGALDVYVLRDGQVLTARDGDTFYEGDRLQFLVRPGSYRALHLFSLDAAGRVTPFFPENGGLSLPLSPDGEQLLSHSIALDDVIGLERIFAIFAEGPFRFEEVEEAVEQLRAREPLPLALDRIQSLPLSGKAQVSFLMVKQATVTP